MMEAIYVWHPINAWLDINWKKYMFRLFFQDGLFASAYIIFMVRNYTIEKTCAITMYTINNSINDKESTPLKFNMSGILIPIFY